MTSSALQFFPNRSTPVAGSCGASTRRNMEVELEAQTLEFRIRIRAYELWQQDGGMEGCADEYWRQAREMVERELAEEQERTPRSD
ncbi:DUF2934 domain-containing protein [Caballeronia humi]|uniref:DUF2934 domain-containing protein n=1 Tax=Caballeronia humi TaxID=326474 RepID=UPI002E147CA9